MNILRVGQVPDLALFFLLLVIFFAGIYGSLRLGRYLLKHIKKSSNAKDRNASGF